MNNSIVTSIMAEITPDDIDPTTEAIIFLIDNRYKELGIETKYGKTITLDTTPKPERHGYSSYFEPLNKQVATLDIRKKGAINGKAELQFTARPETIGDEDNEEEVFIVTVEERGMLDATGNYKQFKTPRGTYTIKGTEKAEFKIINEVLP